MNEPATTCLAGQSIAVVESLSAQTRASSTSKLCVCRCGLLQCKILGETLNVTVQALVAGAFVSYMPTTIFWLR